MRFSTAAILPLAALASAAVLPRSQLGSWAVSVSKSAFANGFQSETATAVYTSDSYPAGITSSCSYEYDPTVTEGDKGTTTCTEGFTYSYDGTTVSLSQVVQKPSPNTTVFGSAPLTLTSNASGRTFTGQTTVDVSSASA
ncbi:uncharacterized protein M421DRAFT_894 [Didymella exigua CBS 183.55]|uniref:AA1-like domain-containing protein n=1 Tax=Didymella exigua CBS 183.55 TaxID=1150837 RepID=A0A6A5S050_9PLEO|nr:uncharacterized protein M421DRAFT_894 [Didymella exigua CBS 183.55]KAF1933492.1 hypothetical protein M421DRAFT_894 [Didymella exigua CBS 183.55]